MVSGLLKQQREMGVVWVEEKRRKEWYAEKGRERDRENVTMRGKDRKIREKTLQ